MSSMTNSFLTPSQSIEILHFQNYALIRKLYRLNTLVFIAWGILTFGIYYAHYVKQQSFMLNKYSKASIKIPVWFIYFTFVSTYLSALMFVYFSFIDDRLIIDITSALLDLIARIAIVIWGYLAAYIVCHECDIQERHRFWFNRLLIFILTPIYFNFKINQILKDKLLIK